MIVLGAHARMSVIFIADLIGMSRIGRYLLVWIMASGGVFVAARKLLLFWIVLVAIAEIGSIALRLMRFCFQKSIFVEKKKSKMSMFEILNKRLECGREIASKKMRVKWK